MRKGMEVQKGGDVFIFRPPLSSLISFHIFSQDETDKDILAHVTTF